ncbi:MAG TPA: alkaline phosphatase PhoX [Acidimicrobiales bacterium]
MPLGRHRAPRPAGRREGPWRRVRPGASAGRGALPRPGRRHLAGRWRRLRRQRAGNSFQGQVWRYTPVGDHRGKLKLVYESAKARTLNQPDAIEAGARDVVVLAEDGNGGSPGGTNYLRVLNPKGRILDLAQVIEPLDLHYWDPEDNPKPGAYGASEMAGPRWSPDGSRLFINVQYPGVTCVIEGPWNKLR